MKVSGKIHVPAALPPSWGRASDTYLIGEWVGPTADLDAMREESLQCPCQELNPGFPSCSLLTTLTELPILYCGEMFLYFEGTV
jgi:hypothetical protein